MKRQFKVNGEEVASSNIVRIPLGPSLLRDSSDFDSVKTVLTVHAAADSQFSWMNELKNVQQETADIKRKKPENSYQPLDQAEHINFLKQGRWNKEEHEKVIKALDAYGNNWTEVERCVGTRNSNQIRSHLQKYFLKKRKAEIKKLQKEGVLESKIFIITKEYRNQKIAAKRRSRPKQCQLVESAVCSFEPHSIIQEPIPSIIDINDELPFNLERDYEREHSEYNFLESFALEEPFKAKAESLKEPDEIAFESLDFLDAREEAYMGEDKDELAWT